jgi:RND superfamily putative drug exporter
MLLNPTTIFRSTAAGAIAVVLVAVAASLTLLPALLAVMGDRSTRCACHHHHHHHHHHH